MPEPRILRLEVCWYSLALCIMKEMSIEQAFEVIAPELPGSKSEKSRDIGLQMFKARQNGYTWDKVGTMFGCSKHAAFRRVERYLKYNSPSY